MGYYVHIMESNAHLPAENADEAYRRMCELNNNNGMKRGGRYPRAEDAVGPHENYWFSWMEWNYPETCKTAEEIFMALGFECSTDEEGNVWLNYYESKAGQEDLFLDSISDLLVGSISWKGEDDCMWRQEFGGPETKLYHAEITWKADA